MRSTFASNRRSTRRLIPAMLLALVLAFNVVAPQSLQAVEVDVLQTQAMATGGGTNTTALAVPITDTFGAGGSSSIAVSGLAGAITKVTVTLSGVTHPRPDDFDIMLTGPGGSILLWSDACGSVAVNGISVTFDDAAAGVLGDSPAAGCSGGTYKPTNFDGASTADVPSEDFGLAAGHHLLSFFNGQDPNGTWTLTTQDDRAGNTGTPPVPSVGSISGGWSITIETDGADIPNTPPTITAILDQTMTTGTTLDLTLSATDPDVGDTITFGASSDNTGIVTTAVAGNTLTLTAVAAGAATITVTATDGTDPAVPVTFNVLVTDPVPGVPVINPIPDQNMLVGDTLNVPISATDPDSDPLTYGASSSNGAVVSATVVGTDVVLDALAAGSATITVTVSDGTNTATEMFLVTVVTEPVQPTPGTPGTPATPEPTPSGPIYTEEDHRRAQAPLCADLAGQTNPAVRASVPDGAVPGGTVNCRVLAIDGVFPNPIDSARVGDPGLITYGIISAVDVFGVNSNGFADPTFEHAVTVCLQGEGRFIYLSALNSPRTTFEMPSFEDGGYTCASIPAAGTVVLIPPQPMN